MRSFFKSPLAWGGILFFIGMLLGLGVSWKTLNQEETAFIQQSLGETTSWVTAQVNTQIDRWTLESHRVLDLGPSTLIAQNHPRSAVDAGIKVTPYSEIETIDMSPEILDVSLWRKDTDWVRSKTIMNGRFTLPSGDWGSRLMSQNELPLLNQAEKGHPVLAGNWALSSGNSGFLTLAFPWNDGQIVVAHIQLEVLFPIIQKKGGGGGGLIWVEIVDQKKDVLASPDGKRLGRQATSIASGILDAARSPSTSGIAASQLVLNDPEDGEKIFAAFHRAKNGLVVIAHVVAKDQMTGVLTLLLKSLPLALGALILLLIIQKIAMFTGGWPQAAREDLNEQANKKSELTPSSIEARRVQAVVVHGVMREQNWMVERLSPSEVQENFNELLRLIKYRIETRSGKFESAVGGRFTVYWTHEQAVDHALMFALELRQDLIALNESRKVDGARSISFGMGICSVSVVEGATGLIGDAFDRVRSLELLTRIAGTDILISQSLWIQIEDKFLGECLGEAKLSRDSGLSAYFSLRGFRTASGEDVLLEAAKVNASPNDGEDMVGLPVRGQERSIQLRKWLINNGSQIIGPLSAEQIAGQLFSQELDFDCECWEEGTGESSKIGEAKIFSGSQDSGALFWVFDGATVHGPLSRGFLTTAIKHSVLDPKVSYVCTGSTIQGWQLLSDWLTSSLPGDGSGTQVA